MSEEERHREIARVRQGNLRSRDKLRGPGKLFPRELLKLLLDPGTELQEDSPRARSQAAETRRNGVHPV